MKKKLLIFLITLISFLGLGTLNYSVVFAESADEILREREAERIEKLVADLKLVVPEITSEPSPVLTFTPIKGDVIELQINGKGFNEIKSPYQMTGLSIGKYVLDFRYIDASDITQTFTKNLIIVPREARMQNQKLLFKEGDEVIINGTALPFSYLEMWVISGSEILFKTSEVDKEGNWSINLSEGLACGDYKIITMVRKDGLSSATSTALNVSYCVDGKAPIIENSEDVQDTTLSERWSNLVKYVRENDNSIILIVGSLVAGLVLGIIYSIVSIKRVKTKLKQMIGEKLDVSTSGKSMDKIMSDVFTSNVGVETVKKNKKGKKEKMNKPVEDEDVIETKISSDSLVGEQDDIVDEVADESEVHAIEDSDTVAMDVDDEVDTEVDELESEVLLDEKESKAVEKDVVGEKKKKGSFLDRFKRNKKSDNNTQEEVLDEIKEDETAKDVKVKKSNKKTFSRDEFLSKFEELEKSKKGPKITLTSKSDSDLSE